MKSVILKLFIFFILVEYVYASFKQEIVIDTAVNYLYNSPQISISKGKKRHEEFENRFKIKEKEINYKRDFYFIFRYRDIEMVPVWDRVLTEKPENIILKVWYINAIAQLGVDTLLYKVAKYKNSTNSIVREYVANAYAYLGAQKHIDSLKFWLHNEKNDYVIETIKNSIQVILKGGYKKRIHYLPRFYDAKPKKFEFFYNFFVSSYKGGKYYYKEESSDTLIMKPTYSAVLPHQQYLWRIKNAPPAGYFGNNHGYTYHVGEDSGWLFDGLPVHAIATGVVRRIQHESSWGNLVVIESKLPEGNYVCTIYGHLGKDLDIEVDEQVYTGQKIGQIGNSLTLENGGYVSHVHVGIELSNYRDAELGGYSININRYTSPKLFVGLIEKRNKQPKHINIPLLEKSDSSKVK